MVFIKSFKNQIWLFPPAIEDLIPEDHVCFLVENFIDSLDLSVFEEKYEGAGHPYFWRACFFIFIWCFAENKFFRIKLRIIRQPVKDEACI